MKPFRWLAAGLVWILACLVGLVGGLLCVTIILLPVGLLLISLSRRLFRLAGVLVLPRALRHPVSELGDTGEKSLHKTTKAARKQGRKASKKLPGRQRRVLGIKV